VTRPSIGAVAAVVLPLAAIASLVAACEESGDFLFDESTPEATGTPTFLQRSPEPSPEGSPTPTPAPGEPGVCGDTYTVVSGDYPIKIAETCGIDEADRADWAAELLELNDIKDSRSLKVGQVLKVPGSEPTGEEEGTDE
jgi:Tfp pilus assembly protein FimV